MARREENGVFYELKGELINVDGTSLEVLGGKKRDQQDSINLDDMVGDIQDFIERVGMGANIELKLSLKETKN